MKIFGIGNPLLDVQAHVTFEFLKEFGLDPDAQILAKTKTHAALFDAIKMKPGVTFVPGGSTQNALRVAQWVLTAAGIDKATTFAGCVGEDTTADIMRSELERAGVQCLYQTTTLLDTGVCAVCIVGHGRSLVASLGASEKFSASFLIENFQIWQSHEIFYNEGFFITVSPESISLVSKYAEEAGKIYATNISSRFIAETQMFRDVLMENIDRTDILFGNETEAHALAKGLGWSLSLTDIACKLSMMPKRVGWRPRIIVLTRGASETVIAEGGRIDLVPTVQVPQEEIRDTNGAGDAYVGGFLAGVAQKLDTRQCCYLGAYAASVVIRRIGCTTC